MGLIAYRKAGNINAKMVSRDVLEVSVKLEAGVTYQAGQYVFWNVPCVSFLGWHPFYLTPSSNADGNKMQFHIKESGKWTKEVISAIINNYLWVCLDAFMAMMQSLHFKISMLQCLLVKALVSLPFWV